MNYSYLKEEDDKNSSFFDFYECNRKYFDNCNIDEYPLCVNMVDTNQHLPVKIHPYRRVTQTQPNGVKEKIIYVVSTEPKTDFVYGITTNNMEEIKKFIANERYGRLLNRKRIKKGDVIYVPAGTLYGYRKSCTVIEIENNLDSVFTFYNYDGEVTDTESVIETKDALNSIFLPFNENIIPKISKFGKLNTHLFNVKIINTILYFGKYEFNDARWLQCVVVSGKALLN
jgi:mannose-6-phosphate isomerase class I